MLLAENEMSESVDSGVGQQDARFYSKHDLNLLEHLILQFPSCVWSCSGGLLELVNRKITPPDGCGTESRWLITKWPDQGKPI